MLAPGVWTLAVLAGLLLIVVRRNTQAVIPRYAIGVFTGFTLSQSGLVVCQQDSLPGTGAGRQQDTRAREAGIRPAEQAGLECAFGILVELEGSDRPACVIETVVIYR